MGSARRGEGRLGSKYLVTGAAGFIGRSIAAALLERGESGARHRQLYHRQAGKPGRAWREWSSSRATWPIRRCAREPATGVEIVFHEAALASVPRSVADPVATNVNCVDATLNVLVAARAAGVRRVVYAGSSSAYGDTPTLPKREEHAAQPDLALRRGQAGRRALHARHLRGFTAWRPWCCAISMYLARIRIRRRTTRACWRFFAGKMLAGEQPTIYGDGEQSRDFTYIDNVVHANLLAAAAPAEKVSGRMMNTATGEASHVKRDIRDAAAN